MSPQLLWPALLRAPAAALWPSRLGLAVIAAILLALLGGLNRLWSDAPAFGQAVSDGQSASWGAALAGLLALDPSRALAHARTALLDHPLDLLQAYPLSTPILGLCMLAVASTFGGAIARSVAHEVATHQRPAAPAVLGWSAARAPGLLVTLGAPLALILLGVALLRALGWIALALPGLDVVGALLAPFLGFLGIAMMALAVGSAAAGPMLVPARVVEDSDAIDAVQRSLAYTLFRPLRLLVYVGLSLGVCALALAAFDAIVRGGWSLALDQAQSWLSDARRDTLAGVATESVAPAGDDAAPASSATVALAARILRFWSAVPEVLVAAYAISLFFTASTRVYLAMRQVCDGQVVVEVQGAGR